MLDVVENTEARLDRAERRALIQQEIRANPDRSDRDIARGIGCDHKTVGSVRAEMGKICPENSPTERTTAQLLADSMPHIDTEGEAFKDSLARIEESAKRADARQALGMDADDEEEQTLVSPRREITVQFLQEPGRWVLRQKNWPDEDSEIWINEEDVHDFLEALCDRLGVAAVGRRK